MFLLMLLISLILPVDKLQNFEDLDGQLHSLKASSDQNGMVLILVTTDCPIANSYMPTLVRLRQEYHKKGFEFILVHEGPDQTASKLKAHAKEFEVPFPVIMDAEHLIAKRLNASKTPEVFVLGREGQVLYQGRIDNLHQGFGKKRAVATREDLRIAMDEIEAGKNVSMEKTEAVGCSIQLK